MTLNTVNTVPEATLAAFIDHGTVQEAFTDSPESAFSIIERLRSVGIDIDVVNQQLLDDGCTAFDEAFEDLLDSLKSKASELSVR